jgi:hypothetical protein
MTRRAAAALAQLWNPAHDSVSIPPVPIRLAILLCTLPALAACSVPAHSLWEPVVRLDDVLWLPPGAAVLQDAFTPVRIANGRSLHVDGSASVVFTVAADREALSYTLRRHFAALEWNERTTEYLNPRIPTSFGEGWIHECGCVIPTDARGNRVSVDPYYKWRGEWQNAAGNVVTYSLSALGRQLRGYAAYVPRRIVSRSQRSRAVGQP